MFQPLIAKVRIDGAHQLSVSIGPDDDIRAEPLARRARELLQKLAAATSLSEPENDTYLWTFDARVGPSAATVAPQLSTFLAGAGCIVTRAE